MAHFKILNVGNYTVGGCCAISTLQGFGYNSSYVGEKAVKELGLYLKDIADDIKAATKWTVKQGQSLMFVSIREDQDIVEETLIAGGFVPSLPTYSYRHPGFNTTKAGIKTFIKQVNPEITKEVLGGVPSVV